MQTVLYICHVACTSTVDDCTFYQQEYGQRDVCSWSPLRNQLSFLTHECEWEVQVSHLRTTLYQFSACERVNFDELKSHIAEYMYLVLVLRYHTLNIRLFVSLRWIASISCAPQKRTTVMLGGGLVA